MLICIKMPTIGADNRSIPTKYIYEVNISYVQGFDYVQEKKTRCGYNFQKFKLFPNFFKNLANQLS